MKIDQLKLKKISQIGFWFMFALITFSSLITFGIDTSSRIAGFRIDYIYHFCAYLFLSLFFCLWKYEKPATNKLIYFSIIFGLFFSIIFELFQYYIPGRVFNPLDFLSNILGFTMGIIIFFILRIYHYPEHNGK